MSSSEKIMSHHCETNDVRAMMCCGHGVNNVVGAHGLFTSSEFLYFELALGKRTLHNGHRWGWSLVGTDK